jgi:hypothetical protein
MRFGIFANRRCGWSALLQAADSVRWRYGRRQCLVIRVKQLCSPTAVKDRV